MNRKLLLVAQGIFAIVLGGAVGLAVQHLISTPQAKAALKAGPLFAVDTGFTYQGYLSSGGVPASGLYDFTFKLTSPNGSVQLGSTITLTNQTVNNGLFTVSLDFGDAAFVGQQRHVRMGVRPAGVGSFDTVSSQTLSPVPYALGSSWTGVSDKPWNYSPFREANVSTVITSNVNIVLYSAITVGSDGLPFIAHMGIVPGGLGLIATHCETLDCSDFTTRMVFTDTVENISATLGRDGQVLIVGSDVDTHNLVSVHCNDVNCAGFVVSLLDSSSSNIGADTSLAMGADGLGLISYEDVPNGDLKVAHCNNVNCTSATITTLDSTGNVGDFNAVTTGYDGLGLISYADLTAHTLKVAHCSNTNCTSATITTLDNSANVGGYTSIATGADGLGFIAYRDATNTSLKVAHCNDAVCTGASIHTLDSTGDVGSFTSVVAGVDGLPIITYFDQTNGDFKVAQCRDVVCTGANTRALVAYVNGNVGEYSSLTWGIDGLPIMSFFDDTDEGLVVLHCGSPTCVSDYHAR